MGEWLTTLKLLVNNTSSNPADLTVRSEVIKVPLSARHGASFDANRFFSFLSIKHNVTAQFVNPGEDASDWRYVSLKGEASALSDAREELLEAYETLEHVASTEADRLLSAQQAFVVRVAYTRPSKHDAELRRCTLADIVPPRKMDTIEFFLYVERLVLAKPSRLHLKARRPDVYGISERKHVDKVSRILVALFETDTLRPCWSTRASTYALQYLAHHRRIPQVRRIMTSLMSTGSAKADVFNASLESAAKGQDLKNFQYIVEMMNRSNIKATPRTWVLLLRMMVKYDKAAALGVLKYMRSRHILNSPQARLSALEVLVSGYYEDWLAAGGTSKGFFDHYKHEFDIEYFNDSILLSLTTYHTQRNDFDGLETVLALHAQSGRRPTSAHLEQALSAALMHGNAEGAIAACESMLGRWPHIPLSAKALDAAFNLAVRRKFPGLASVIWRYACMEGHVSFPMTKKLRQSILKSPTASESLALHSKKRRERTTTGATSQQPGITSHVGTLLRRDLFDTIFGITAIGLRLGNVGVKEWDTSASKMPAYMSRKERLDLMIDDMKWGIHCKAHAPFHEMLKEAYIRDVHFKKHGAPDNLLALTMACLQVPVHLEGSETIDGLAVRPK
ncbi:hypothetical protein CAC42_4058 [Sphaceloma murrayae]|uniref:Uncharacterized protein n=1 Tax=Sphaceloma murrayae TaxID=2082308 RepID=A0A2K1QSY1_9PEZI|nr:hypothetical protein CAC42_4058 [Sphaceloma murrayae]